MKVKIVPFIFIFASFFAFAYGADEKFYAHNDWVYAPETFYAENISSRELSVSFREYYLSNSEIIAYDKQIDSGELKALCSVKTIDFPHYDSDGNVIFWEPLPQLNCSCYLKSIDKIVFIEIKEWTDSAVIELCGVTDVFRGEDGFVTAIQETYLSVNRWWQTDNGKNLIESFKEDVLKNFDVALSYKRSNDFFAWLQIKFFHPEYRKFYY